MTKIIFGINVPFKTMTIDWEATVNNRKESGKFQYGDYVHVPCIRHKDLFFELCGYCGNQIIDGRAKRKLRSCSPECNKKLGGAWAHHTYIKEREQKGKRPIFFWGKIRDECFERDDYKCQGCGVDITEHIKRGFKPPESHHIIPVSKGGSNQIENLKTLCYDCHKLEHSTIGNRKRQHKCLVVD